MAFAVANGMVTMLVTLLVTTLVTILLLILVPSKNEEKLAFKANRSAPRFAPVEGCKIRREILKISQILKASFHRDVLSFDSRNLAHRKPTGHIKHRE